MTYSIYNQRIDFIHYFPNEIINTIFSFLSFRDRIHCLETSSAWRQYLLSWSLFWSDLDDPDCDIGKDLLSFKQYIKKDSIQRVKICELNVDQQRRALDFLVKLKSRSIKSIIFSYRDDMKNSFDSLLACTGYSITNIDIKIQHSPKYFLEHLLIHCPNIESIKHITGARPERFVLRGPLFIGQSIRRLQQDQQHLIEATTKSITDKQQLQRTKIKSLYLKNVTSIRQILNGDINIPNIEYINILSSSPHHIKHIRQQGWPQLRYLYLKELYLTEEGVKSLTAAIFNMPFLISLIFNDSCYFSTQTNELFSAIGNLEHLEELCIIDRQNDVRIPSGNLSSQIHVNEEGYLALLNGKCRRTLRKLKLLPIPVLTNRILAAISNNHHHHHHQHFDGEQQQQQLSCLDISQLYKEHSKEVLTDEGLCTFVSIMSRFKMDFLRLKLQKNFKFETFEYINNRLGLNSFIVAPNNRVYRKQQVQISDTGTWLIDGVSGSGSFITLASVSDHVKHYAYEKRK